MSAFTVFNQKEFDSTKEDMFFGESVGVSRFDVQRHPAFEHTTVQQLGFFWVPEEIDVSKDRRDFDKMAEHERHIFLSNLKYQTLLDSVQGRSPNLAFLPIVSLPELETWIESWSFSECLAEGTEVLTTEGWRDLGDVTTSDDCLVYDLQNETVHFESPKRVVEYDVDTDLVRYQSTITKQFDQLVTPNHRMPVIHRDVRQDGTRKKYFNEAIHQDYKPHHLAPISGRIINQGQNSISAFERLKVAIQADANFSKKLTGARSGFLTARFEFKKESKIKRLISLAREAGLEVEETKPSVNRRFKIKIPLSMVDGDMKTFKWVKLGEVSYEWCLGFMEELSCWDSHIINNSSFTYSTTVKENADVVQAIASMCGYSPRLTVHVNDAKDTYKDVYSINIIKQDFKDGQSIKRRYEKYKGKVRCLETSTGAFVIRYNGVVSVTGNTIHSRSYTHIMRNALPDASEILDSIVSNEAIQKRATDITKYYDELIQFNNIREAIRIEPSTNNKFKYNEYDHKVALFKAMVAVNCLEAIRFYVSFACSFAFAENDLMAGNASIIKLISRDEALHLKSTEYIINSWRRGNDDPEMQEIYNDYKHVASEIFHNAIKQEEDWADYLFSMGSMLGLNANILKEYVRFIGAQRMKAIGIEPNFTVKDNPLPWMKYWLNSSSVQTTPQEKEIISYVTGGLDSSVEEDFMGTLSL